MCIYIYIDVTVFIFTCQIASGLARKMLRVHLSRCPWIFKKGVRIGVQKGPCISKIGSPSDLRSFSGSLMFVSHLLHLSLSLPLIYWTRSYAYWFL